LGIKNLKHKLSAEINYVVVGHTGYIGSALTNKLSKNNNGLILGISRGKKKFKNIYEKSNLIEINCDIFTNSINNDHIFQIRPIVYIAAHNIQTNFLYKRESLENIYFNNIEYYKILMGNLKKLNPKKIIFLSSAGSLYDNSQKSNPSHENSILNPTSNYGISKFILENLLNSFSMEYCIPLTICRLSTVYGNSPSIKKFGFINYLINCSQTNNIPYLYGESTYRDYLNLEDLIEILTKISEINLINNIYNVSNGTSYSCLQIYKKVKEKLEEKGYKLRQYENKGLRSGENSKIFISPLKLINEMKFVPKISIDEGIKRITMELN